MTVSIHDPAGADVADVIDDLYRAHGLGLVRFALMLVGDQGTAEDVVQEAFLGLYRGWHRVRDQGSMLAYLRTAVVNGARSVHRHRQRGPPGTAGRRRGAATPPAPRLPRPRAGYSARTAPPCTC
jgi:DNA-directed RNA polymerase specialized sigma24 family protein